MNKKNDLNAVFLATLLILSVSCQKNGNKLFVSKKGTGKVSNKTMQDEIPVCSRKDGDHYIDLPAYLEQLYKKEKEVFRITTQDIAIIRPITQKIHEAKDDVNPSLPIDISQNELEAVISAFKKEGEHIDFVLGKFLQQGSALIPFPKGHCDQQFFENSPTSNNIHFSVSPTPLEIINKKDDRVTYEINNGGKKIQLTYFIESNSTLIFSKIIPLDSPSIPPNTYLRITKRIVHPKGSYPHIYPNVIISLRLAKIWEQALPSDQVPEDVEMIFKNIKPNMKADSLFLLATDVYSSMNAHLEKNKDIMGNTTQQ